MTPEQRRFLRFLLVGGLNTAVGYGLFAAFILLGAGSSAALAGATVLGIAFNFKSTGRLVFGSGDGRLLPRFIAVYAVQFLVNWLALKALERAGMDPLLAQLTLVLPMALIAFLMMRRFVFAGALRSAPAAPSL